jgi:hypothetical protein
VIPLGNAVAVTPADGTAVAFRAIYVGGAGDVAGKWKNSPARVTWKAVPAGTVIAGQWVEVAATGTTATSILGLS